MRYLVARIIIDERARVILCVATMTVISSLEVRSATRRASWEVAVSSMCESMGGEPKTISDVKGPSSPNASFISLLSIQRDISV